MKKEIFLICISVLYINTVLSQQEHGMKKIIGGDFVPLYGVDSTYVTIQDFAIDIYPITNEEYLAFLNKYPKWERSKVIRLFADKNYLYHWQDDITLHQDANHKSPITNVSWYAAKAYCASIDKRLPTMDEWEYVAMASPNKSNAQKDSIFNQQIIAGYERPRTYKNTIGSTDKNYWGIYDLHGLVWEWTSDFNSVLISGESRKDVDTDRSLFCAGGAVNANDLMDYAAFMRYAFRGSLKANYSIQSLGFRCANDQLLK